MAKPCTRNKIQRELQNGLDSALSTARLCEKLERNLLIFVTALERKIEEVNRASEQTLIDWENLDRSQPKGK